MPCGNESNSPANCSNKTTGMTQPKVGLKTAIAMYSGMARFWKKVMGARQRAIPSRAISAPPVTEPRIVAAVPRPFKMLRWPVSMPISRNNGLDIANIMMSPSL